MWKYQLGDSLFGIPLMLTSLSAMFSCWHYYLVITQALTMWSSLKVSLVYQFIKFLWFWYSALMPGFLTNKQLFGWPLHGWVLLYCLLSRLNRLCSRLTNLSKSCGIQFLYKLHRWHFHSVWNNVFNNQCGIMFLTLHCLDIGLTQVLALPTIMHWLCIPMELENWLM